MKLKPRPRRLIEHRRVDVVDGQTQRRHTTSAGLPTIHTVDNQRELLPRVLAERNRRRLYSDCERAPFGWEKQLA